MTARSGRLYIDDGEQKHRFNFRMEYDPRVLEMILSSPWGEAVAYISFEKEELLVKTETAGAGTALPICPFSKRCSTC